MLFLLQVVFFKYTTKLYLHCHCFQSRRFWLIGFQLVLFLSFFSPYFKALYFKTLKLFCVCLKFFCLLNLKLAVKVDLMEQFNAKFSLKYLPKVQKSKNGLYLCSAWPGRMLCSQDCRQNARTQV